MTLCVAFLSHRLCVVCADRRITSGTRVKSEEHDKMLVISTEDAKAVLTFSGLACVERFDTHKWLMEAVRSLGPPDYTLAGIINRLQPALTNEFKTNGAIRNVLASDRRLSVMITGYVYQKSKG